MSSLSAHLSSLLSAFKARHRPLAAQHLADLIASTGAGTPNLWMNAAKIGEIIGETTATIAASERAAATLGNDRQAALQHAAVLARLGRKELALRELTVHAGFAARDPRFVHLAGSLSSELGDFTTAEGLLDEALVRMPEAGQIWTARTALSPLAPAQREALHMQAGRDSGREEDAYLHYALGQDLDRAGEPAAAWRSYCRGAQILSAGRPFDADANDRIVREKLAQSTTAAVKAARPSAAAGAPIFIMGLPRSGTTLLATRLAGINNISSIGESNLSTAALMGVPGRSAQGLIGLDTTEIGNDFCAIAADRAGVASGRIVDKSFVSARQFGALAAVLPQATFLYLQRDPRAIAVSCFRTPFATGLGWTFSLAAIGRYVRAETVLLETLAERFPSRIRVVSYEDLAADPVATATSLAPFLSLDPDQMATAFTPSGTARSAPVDTASAVQVRQPIRPAPADALCRYGDVLQEFERAFSA